METLLQADILLKLDTLIFLNSHLTGQEIPSPPCSQKPTSTLYPVTFQSSLHSDLSF
jgi:hypothetical protein